MEPDPDPDVIHYLKMNFAVFFRIEEFSVLIKKIAPKKSIISSFIQNEEVIFSFYYIFSDILHTLIKNERSN